jgi:hypothetical protein
MIAAINSSTLLTAKRSSSVSSLKKCSEIEPQRQVGLEGSLADLGAFRGWYPPYVGGEASTSYSPILQGRGF